jgi:hypothetical protein
LGEYLADHNQIFDASNDPVRTAFTGPLQTLPIPSDDTLGKDARRQDVVRVCARLGLLPDSTWKSTRHFA